FVPLSLSVGFCMLASFLLSSTLVPIMAVWLIKEKKEEKVGFFERFIQRPYEGIVKGLIPLRIPIMICYLAICTCILYFVGTNIGTEMFPSSERNEFRIRLRAPTGTRIEVTEILYNKMIELIKNEVGAGNVKHTLGYVGTQPPTYAIASAY